MTVPPEERRARHRASDVDSETRVLPLFTPPRDNSASVADNPVSASNAETSVIPRISAPVQAAAAIPVHLPAPSPNPADAETSVIPLPKITVPRLDADATSVLTRIPDAPSWHDDKSTISGAESAATPLEEPATPPDGKEQIGRACVGKEC